MRITLTERADVAAWLLKLAGAHIEKARQTSTPDDVRLQWLKQAEPLLEAALSVIRYPEDKPSDR